jgi:bifunctional non-homologous end joining protein LigD
MGEKNKTKNVREVQKVLSSAPKSVMPKNISPMLATLVDKPFDEEGWTYEIKWDGYRAVAFCNGEKVTLMSRNKKSFDEKFYAVHDALARLGLHTVIDGEIVVLNEKGVSDFGSLQNWRSEADGDLIYYVFDLLWIDGRDLRELPLVERRKVLDAIIPSKGIIRESENFETTPSEFLEAAKKVGLEGIVAKKSDSLYTDGIRSREWLKIKVQKRHEVVIGGYTKNDDSPKLFSSLLVGVHENGKLKYTGKIGTGFSDKLQKEIMAKLMPLRVKTSPFTSVPDVNKPSRFRPNPPNAVAIWVKPKLVCEVSYTEMTGDGVMRHPSFEGMRIDKPAKDVKEEIASETKRIVKQKSSGGKTVSGNGRPNNKIKLEPVKSKDRKTLLNPSEKSQVKNISGHELKFNNLDKIYWPDVKVTKREMINYYYQIAPVIVAYLKSRLQSLNRFPNGIKGKSFYQKDVTAIAPEWMKLFPYHTSEGGDKNYLAVEDEASLLWMANLGAIEMNPWNSTIKNPDNPDWCIIDLDPTEKNTFDQVIEVAQTTKKVLDEYRIKGYCKTSGSTGIHIYIPLAAKYDYSQCQLFGKIIATEVHRRHTEFTSIERLTNNRKGKIYVDYLQNRPKATLAAPYSLRPKPGATVSMPIHWEELKKGLKMSQFNIKNAMQRVLKEGDIFKPVLGKGAKIERVLASGK